MRNDSNSSLDLSVIICTYNRTALLNRCLETLLRQIVDAKFRWEIIVVCNNSPKATWDLLKEFAQKVKNPVCLRSVSEIEQGKTFALNRGVTEAQGKVLAFTDDDNLLPENWVQRILEIFQRNNCEGIGGKVIPVWENLEQPFWYTEESPFKLKGVILHYDKGNEPFIYDGDKVALPIGANMAFRKETFERFGLFETRLGYRKNLMVSGEDVEFCKRVMRGGGKILYAPELIVRQPVEKERIKIDFVKRWYYGIGQTLVLARVFPEHVSTFFGIPKYEIRELFRSILFWIRYAIFGNCKARFFYEMQVLRGFGILNGAFRKFVLDQKTKEKSGELIHA